MKQTNKGFTLIELMVAMLVFSVVIAAVYATHVSQQKIYQTQEQVAEMQQTLRAAFIILMSDIRMAGYDPAGTANAGILIANPGHLQISIDLNENGALDATETIDIGFPTAIDVTRDGIPDADANGDGVPDAATIERRYNTSTEDQPLAENIQAIEFRYLDSAGTEIPAPVAINTINTIQLTILARTYRRDGKYINSTTYITPSGQNWGPYNDHFRRRILTTTIQCRNLGL